MEVGAFFSESLTRKDTLRLVIRSVYELFVIEYLYNLQFLSYGISECFLYSAYIKHKKTDKQKFMFM